MVAFLGVRVDVAGVVIGTEVGEVGVLVGEQVPDDDQDGTSDGDYPEFFVECCVWWGVDKRKCLSCKE